MAACELNVVTGAFGYTGRYIARRLLSLGKQVATLTRRPIEQSPFGRQVRAMPLQFDRLDALTASLAGATTLYNTYWVRFPRRRVTFETAVENTRTLIQAAQDAGVRRIVQVSITNPSLDSPLGYFRGKARLEEAVRASTMSHAIVRPTVIFGPEDVLINNIAFILRKLPIFGLFGAGDYRLQPIFVEDFADLVVDAGQRSDNMTFDAVGPETFTYAELVRLIRDTIHRRTKIVHLPPSVALAIGKLAGLALGDVIVTREEIDGLMAGLLVSDRTPTGQTSLSEWLERNADRVGTVYASELERHYA